MKAKQSIPVSLRMKGIIALIIMFIFMILSTGSLMAQWNPNTSVNIQISGLPTADIQSAPTTDGKTWIAFYHENSGNYDMRAQLIDANGFKLLGADGILVDSYTSGSATFVFNVCVDASNNLIIGMQDQRSSDMQAVLYKISQTGTQLWGASGIVLGAGLCPYPCALSNGEVAAAWNDNATNTLLIQKITTSGTTAWTTPVSVMVGTSKTTRGQIIANSVGSFTMVYQKKGTGVSSTLYAQRYDNAGTALYAPLQICNQTTSSARYYSIVAENDTTYFGYYSSLSSRFNSFLQRINPDGTIPWGMNGSNFNTSTGSSDPYQGWTSINMAAGTNYVWSVCNFSNSAQSQYGIFVQKFLKTTGARQFTDAAKTVYAISANMDQACGSLALVSNTPMFMMYDATDKIYATRLDADGNFMWPGNRVEVSSTTAGGSTPKMRFGFTPDGPTRCAGVWTENRGTAYMGYAQGISIGGLVGVVVATQGSVPATITTPSGTLQCVATVYPASANQAVTWSIVPGTGFATINATGLVTAAANGTVYAKATAVQDVTMKDSLLITITGQASTAPTVITQAATGVNLTGATLNGTVTANGATTNVSFNWGLTTAYGNTVAGVPGSVSGSTATAVTAALTGLTPGTTYHFRASGTNVSGTTNGSDLTFTTTTAIPTVVTNLATNVGTNSAQLNGTVTANSTTATVSFDYGLTTAYGSNIGGTPSSVAGATPTAVLANVSGLTTLTWYHYRCKAVNSNGTAYGADVTFMPGCQTPVAPGTITGPANVCQGQCNVVYSVAPITNATSYTWTVPAGATISAGQGTTSITVCFTTSSGNITVTGTNSCASGPTGTLAVTVNGLPVPTITGSATLCIGSGSYNYSTESGMTNYTWTVSSGGSIVSGAGTSTISVLWSTAGSQTVTVTYTNASGCQPSAPTSFPVTVNDLPGAAGPITGPLTVCAGTQGAVYKTTPVSGAVSYVWILPTGASIAAGSGSDSITVDYAANAVSGNMSVMGNNVCGNGASSPVLAIVVNPIPPTPVVTVNGTLLTSSAPAGNQWYKNNMAIPGATGQTITVATSGLYRTVVTLNGCSSDSSNEVSVIVGVGDKSAPKVSVNPVPNDGKFSISVSGMPDVPCRLEIISELGVKVYSETVNLAGTTVIPVDLRPVPNGMYTLVLNTADQQFIRKIVINK